MLIWGIVMAKAKSGFNAASSKDHAIVKSTFGKALGMTALIAIASFAKYNSESHVVENWADAHI